MQSWQKYVSRIQRTIHQNKDMKEKIYADASIHRIFSIISTCFLVNMQVWKKGTINKCGSCVYVCELGKSTKIERVRVNTTMWVGE